MKLLSFGEVLWDVYPDKACIGGAPFNFAAHAAIHGENVTMLSAIGDDDLGRQTIAKLQQYHIDTTAVAVLPAKPTGTCVVTLDDNAVPSYDLRDHVAWDAIDPALVTEQSYDVLYFGTLALRHEQNVCALQTLFNTTSFGDVFVDVNIRKPFFSDTVIRFALEHATILKISDEELPVILDTLGLPHDTDFSALCRTLTARYQSLRVMILTKGGDGADAYDVQANTMYTTPCEKATVLSTVGAGDSFSAAFLHCYKANAPLDECLRYAAKIAAFVVSHYDAVPDYTVQ